MKRKLLPRIFITLLGMALLLWGVGRIALGIIGEPETAIITHIRREGGERTDGKPGRYTYNISYTFTLPNGEIIDGSTKQIGDAVYLKADGTGRIAVWYFKTMPYINAPEESSSLPLKQAILTAAGIFLIIQMKRKRTVSK